jgi:hypothetical protein
MLIEPYSFNPRTTLDQRRRPVLRLVKGNSWGLAWVLCGTCTKMIDSDFCVSFLWMSVKRSIIHCSTFVSMLYFVVLCCTHYWPPYRHPRNSTWEMFFDLFCYFSSSFMYYSQNRSCHYSVPGKLFGAWLSICFITFYSSSIRHFRFGWVVPLSNFLFIFIASSIPSFVLVWLFETKGYPVCFYLS